MSDQTDNLAQKLYQAFNGAPSDAWSRVHPQVSARWEQVAAVARDVTMRTELAAIEWLIKASEGDPEATPYLPGMRFLAETRRRVLEMPPDYAERIARGPRP